MFEFTAQNHDCCSCQMEKQDNENARLQQELQDSKDQNELLEFRILELEVVTLLFP